MLKDSVRNKPPDHTFADAMTSLVCGTLNQRRAPLDIRALAADEAVNWPAILAQHVPPTCAWFILTTCNRFEIYLHDAGCETAVLRRVLSAVLADGFRRVHLAKHAEPCSPAHDDEGIGFAPERCGDVAGYFDILGGAHAAEHLCRVAIGLESKVFGESEIQGQITRAYEAHVRQRRLNHELDAIVRTAIRCGKRVRHETPIGAHAGSIGALAVQMAETHIEDWSNAVVAVVGLGEMGQLVAKRVAMRGPRRLLLINRTYERAHTCATTCGGSAVPWVNLAQAVADADVVFCATGARGAVITPDSLRTPRPEREATGASPSGPPTSKWTTQQGGAKLLIDLAVPRDIDPTVAEHFPICLIDLDQLQEDLDNGLAQRHAALPAALEIISAEMARLWVELRELQLRPLIVDLRKKAEHIRRQEVARTLRHLPDVDPETARHIDHLARALVNKLLHEPTVRIRETAGRGDEPVPESIVRHLFGLEEAGDVDDMLSPDGTEAGLQEMR